MAEVATINRTAQIGLETTPGTEVNANKLLQSMAFDLGPEVDITKFRPSGGKFNTIASLNREWAAAGVSGQMTYTEVIYGLASALKKVTPTGAGAAKTWVFAPAQLTADVIATYTLEMGSAERAQLVTNAVFNALSLDFSTEGCEVGGEIIAAALQDGITKTASPTAIALQPVLPKHVRVYIADTQGGLASADPLERLVSARWEISNRFGMVFVLNGSVSYAALVELPVELQLVLRVHANAEGMGPLPWMRSSVTKFLRILAEDSVEVETGSPYSIQIDMAGKVEDVGRFEDEEGATVLEWTFGGFYDATWGKATEVTVVNAITAL